VVEQELVNGSTLIATNRTPATPSGGWSPLVDAMHESLKEEILKEYPRLTPESTFKFSCDKGISCFTTCCADVNILLTPYDVLRMRKALAMPSDDFLGEYVVPLLSVGQKVPLVLLKMKDDEGKTCPFVGAEGCSIYEDRPWPCRMYPVGMASSKTEQGTEGEEFYFLMEEGFSCAGLKQGREWTVAEWWDDQGIGPYNEEAQPYKEVTLHRRLQSMDEGKGLDPAQMQMFYMALYDLDRFRGHIFDSRFLKLFEVDSEVVEKIKQDDQALLDFGYQWVRFSLFREPTMTIRGEAVEKRKEEMEEELERLRGEHE
jgi:Fe-S-cluster containining protein